MSVVMRQPSARERWDAGEVYDAFMGRWSRRVAAEFVAWLDVPGGRDWLDVGCGTGALAGTVVERAAPRAVAAVDPAPGFVVHARDNLRHGPPARLACAEARALPFADASHDAVVSALVLNFVPEPARALAEMARVTRPGGVVGAYVWDYAAGMEYLRAFWDAAAALDPAAAALDEARRFPMCRPEALEELARNAGLLEPEVRAIDVPIRFDDFEDFWRPFLGGQGPAPGYVATLDDARRAALCQRLRATVGEGPIDLVVRAWALRAIR